MTESKKKVLSYIDEKADVITGVSDLIWDYAELSLREFQSAELYVKVLKEEGFTVECPFDGIKTAFRASYGSGKPVIGILAEYDALTGLSQEAGATERKELVADGNGHGCGHNLLGAGSMAAAFALKKYLEEKGEGSGTVVFYGCPGEEGAATKAFMARDGKRFQETARRFLELFFLQEKIVDFGRLYYDLYRGNWSPAGVMVDDGEGNRVVVAVDYDDSATNFKWATKSITKSAILKSAPNFTGIEEITFYFRNTNGGWIYFDNVKFDKTDLGDIGGLDYSKRDKKFVWDAVESATEYELYIDGAEEPFVTDENEVDMTESPLSEGNHTVKLVAVNGTSRREKIFDSIFVDKDMRFNVPKEGSTTEYILAAFDTTEYLQYLQPYNEQMKPTFDITDEGLTLTFNSTYENSSLKYL